MIFGVRVFGLSDLHLSFVAPVTPGNWETVTEAKPMVIFGEVWREHYRKTYENWHRTVGRDDVVLMPGDISWAMRLSEAAYDLAFLGQLPGLIICVPGNHDYWWPKSVSKVRRALPPNMRVIQNDHVLLGCTAICGTRGWLCPNDSYFKESDWKIYRRELHRLELSLRSVPAGVEEIIVMMHFMPTNDRHERSGFIDLLQSYNIKTVVYGHLHARARSYRLPRRAWGINFLLVSADYLDFQPLLIKEVPSPGRSGGESSPCRTGECLP